MVVTADDDLLDDLVRLCAALDREPTVAHDVGAARRWWVRAPVVVAGTDLLEALADAALPRRPGVVAAGRLQAGERTWSTALALGAERVLRLPEDTDDLSDLLATGIEGTGEPGPVVAVLGASGGVGSSTMATALAAVAARDEPVALVDADPLGGGIDLLLGEEDRPGPRWPDLADTQGRLSATALRDVLPRASRLGVLSWDRGPLRQPAPGALDSVLDAARRSHGLVVVDLPRTGPGDEALEHATAVVVVVRADVRGVAAATRLLPGLLERACEPRLVVRRPAGTATDPRLVAETLGLAAVAVVRDDPGLRRAVDEGIGPLARSPRLRRAARDVLDSLDLRVSR
ncbi:UNVERIFIED_CONTAM: hypothetical protein LK11_23140 [Mumia flava]